MVLLNYKIMSLQMMVHSVIYICHVCDISTVLVHTYNAV